MFTLWQLYLYSATKAHINALHITPRSSWRGRCPGAPEAVNSAAAGRSTSRDGRKPLHFASARGLTSTGGCGGGTWEGWRLGCKRGRGAEGFSLPITFIRQVVEQRLFVL